MLEGEDYEPSKTGSLTIMVTIATVLFWLPGLNGLLAGLVGGHRAQKRSRALALAIPAMALVAVIYVLADAMLLDNIAYLTYGIHPLAYLAMTDGGILIGALLGALIERDPVLAPPPRRRRAVA